jgi:transposase
VFMPGDPDSKRGGVTSAVYLEILEDFLPTLWEPGLEFMQDNAKIHTARIIKAWFAEQGIVVVEWPPYSPDLNPIEHVWARLKAWVYKHHPELLKLISDTQANRDKLLAVLQEAWEALPKDFFTKLIESMTRRVKAVKKAKGWYTKY